MAKHPLYIMCGPAGCGKSTFLNNCATKISEGCAIVSRDEIRFNMLKDDMSYFAKEKEVFAAIGWLARESKVNIVADEAEKQVDVTLI